MRGDLVRRIAIGAVADHLVGLRNGHVGERKTVNVDADFAEIRSDQPRAAAGGGKARGTVAVVNAAIRCAGGIRRPFRRLQPLHPAALLVDQNGRGGSQFM